MENRSGFHSKKIGERIFALVQRRSGRQIYDGKDTGFGKVLQHIAVFRRNVTSFAGHLSKSRSI